VTSYIKESINITTNWNSSQSTVRATTTTYKHLLTYSMVQSPSWAANWFAASQEILRISQNQKFHYRTHKRPPPVSRASIPMWMFVNISVLQGGVVSTSPNLQAGGPPLVGRPRPLIRPIRSYPPYRRPFLHPQPPRYTRCNHSFKETRLPTNTRKLKRSWSLDLQGTWDDIAGWIPYHVVVIQGIVA